MSSRCLAKMSLNSMNISSMSFLSSSDSCVSSHLKFLRNASRSWALLVGFSFWISLALDRRVGIRVLGVVWRGEPEVLVVGWFVKSSKEFVDIDYCVFSIVFSEHFECCCVEWFEFFGFLWRHNFELRDRCILFDGVGCRGRVRHSDVNFLVRGR